MKESERIYIEFTLSATIIIIIAIAVDIISRAL
jgi:hypothetical protein